MNIIYVFDRHTWFLLMLTTGCLPFIMALSNKSDTLSKFAEYCLWIWAILLNLSAYAFDRMQPRWLLLIWIWCSVLFSSAFQSSMMTSFLTTRYEKSITTIDEFAKSGLELGIFPYFITADYFPDVLRKIRLVPMNQSESIKYLENKTPNLGYMVSDEFAYYFMNKFQKETGDTIFEIVEETLFTGVLIYHFRKHSPFLQKFDRFLLLMKQHGLLREEKIKSTTKRKNVSDKLTLSHLLVGFHLLLIGHSIAIVIFTMEICRKKFNRGN